MKIFGELLFWLHLISGILGGIVIFIMCVTGTLLSFEKDIPEFAERKQSVAPSENALKLYVWKILAKVFRSQTKL